jgi:hypothetical protein
VEKLERRPFCRFLYAAAEIVSTALEMRHIQQNFEEPYNELKKVKVVEY